ncbi:MAG: hypothetical protein MJ050_05915, partial [Phascolarctobacterium sp.]|nr:hypothetical protein [Phascolarctobacterium sp.]
NYVTVNDKLSLNNDASNLDNDDADNRAKKEAQQEKLLDKLEKAVVKQFTRTKDDDGKAVTPLLKPAAASDISLKGETGAGKALKGMQTELDKAVLAAQNVNVNNTINDKFNIYTGSGTGSILGVIKNRALLEEKNLSQINIAGGSINAKNVAVNGKVTGSAETETALGYVSGVAGNTSWAKISVAGDNAINISAAKADKDEKAGTKINAQNVAIKAYNDGKYTSTAKGGGLAVAGGNELTTLAEDNLNNRVNISDANIELYVEKNKTEENVNTGISIDVAQTSKVNTKTVFGNVSVVGGGVSFFMDSKLNSDNAINLNNNTIKEAVDGQSLNVNALFAGVAEIEAKNGSGSLGGGGSGTYAKAIAKGSAMINATGNDLDFTNINAHSLVGGRAGKDGNDAMTLAKADVHAIDISLAVGGSKNSAEAKIETTSQTDFSNNTFHNTTQKGNVIGYTEVDQLIEETDAQGHIILDENGKPKMKVAMVKKLDDNGNEVKDASGNPIMVPVKIKAPIYEQIPVGKTDLDIKADTIARAFANDDGANVGLGVAVGHKESKVTINETTKASFAAKADAPSYLKALKVDATGLNEVIDTADGSGGGILGISPSAAVAENDLRLITNASVKGKINVLENAEIVAKQKDNLRVTTTIKNGGILAEVGGGNATNTLNEETTVNLTDAELVAQESIISASNDVSMNRENFGGNETYAIKGDSGSAGWSQATNVVLTNKINTKADVSFNNAKVTTYEDLKVNADTINNIFAKAIYRNGGSTAVSEAQTKNTHTYTNAINLSKDSSLRTINSDSRLDLIAADNSNLQIGAYANAIVGLAVTVAMPDTKNTIVRNNNINVTGDIFSAKDLNLYAGDFTGVDIGGLDAVIDCEAYSGSIIPISSQKFESHITENNTVVVAGNTHSVSNTGINATEGSTRIKHNYIEGNLFTSDANRSSEYVSFRRKKFNNDGIESGVVNIINNDNVEISGSVTAGYNHKFALDIGTAKEIVILDEAERNAVKAADNGDLTVAARPTIKLNGSVLTEAEAEKNIGTIKYYASGVGEALLARYDELTSALKNYSEVTDKSKDPTYQKLLVEKDSLITTLSQLGLAHQEGAEGAKYWVVDNKVKANVIELPDIASGGGSINIHADDMSGKGTIKAYGAPDLVVNNYSNMYLKLNNMTVGDIGGHLIVNDEGINCSTTEKANEILANVLKKSGPKEFGEVIATGGSESKIEINGINSVREFKAVVNGKTITEVPYASIELAKNKAITNMSGKVKIDSQNDSLFINGNVIGTEISMTALYGNLTQVVEKGILNVANTPELDIDYDSSINSIIDDEFRFTKDNVVSESDKHKEAEYKDDTTHGRESGDLGIITGGNIFLGAESINVNGLVQSGFGEFFVDINRVGDIDQDKIYSLDLHWDGTPLKDSDIRNANYMISEPGKYYDRGSKLFKYRVGAYYNPSTKKIVVDDIESYSGTISLAGGIISTGNGRIVAMDGAYDINITNNTDRDLQLGKVLSTESKGKVIIHDTYLGTTTEYTRAGGANQVYKPKEGARYNWHLGTNSTIRQYYEHKYESNWWGLHKDVDETTPGSTVVKTERLDNKDKDKVSYIDFDLKAKDGGSLEDYRFYMFGSNNYLTHQKSEVKETPWETGLFGFRKHILSEWNVTTGSSQQYLASAKADMPIAIEFIGRDKATINIDSNASVDVTGNVGSKDKDKATVNIKTLSGHISQNTGAIMASNVNLSAAGHMSGINIQSGNVLNLTAKNTFDKDTKILYNGTATDVSDGNRIDITVKNEVKGSGDNADYGRVNLSSIVGSVWDKKSVQGVSIKASGSIYQNSGLIESRRIDLESTNGQIGSADHYIKVKAGQDVTTTDTLSASINAKAKGDINLEHDWVSDASPTYGDMRIGTIYSESGDVNLKAYGRIIDALPYENIEASGRSEQELIAHWKSLGVVGESETLAKDENGKYITTTTPNDNPVYKTTTVIRDGKEITVIATEKVRDAILDEHGNPMKDKDGNILYGAEHEVKIQEKDANGKPLYYKTTTVDGWDEQIMLYAISDEIINPKSGVELPTKAANIKAHNITIDARYSAGLNSDEIWEERIDDLYLEDLKFLAKQDASNVIWNNPNKEGGKEGYVVVRQKLPLGINQSEGGTLTITAGQMWDEKDLDVNIEARPLDPNAAIIPSMDINIMKIDTYGNAMLKNSMGSIYTAAASQNSTAPTAVIKAKTLDIYADNTTGNGSNIGSFGDMPLYVNLSGPLHATASGDINIQQINSNDLLIESISAGGNIKLVSEKSILGANSTTGAESNGYIRLENDNTTL